MSERAFDKIAAGLQDALDGNVARMTTFTVKPSEVSFPTMNLRVRRSGRMGSVQQMFVIEVTTLTGTTRRHEWRDLPVVNEEPTHD